MKASQAKAQAACESGAALKEHMAEAFRNGAMKNVASLFLGAARTVCVEAQAQPEPANDANGAKDANGANVANGAKVTEDSMTHGHEGMQQASTLIPDGPRAPRCERLAKPKPAEDTEGALTEGTDSTNKEKSHASFPDGSRSSCPETLAEHAPAEGMEDTMAVDKASSDLEHGSSSLPYGPRAMRLAALKAPESTAGTEDAAAVDNVSDGKERSKAGVSGWTEAARPGELALPAASSPVKGLEASGKASKAASGEAPGQASATSSEAEAKLGPDGAACQRDRTSRADSGGQACPAATLPLSEASRRDAGEAQESKQDRPSGEKTPEAKVAPAGGSIPDSSSQKHWDAVPSLGVMGMCEPVPSGIAVIWTRSRDNESFGSSAPAAPSWKASSGTATALLPLCSLAGAAFEPSSAQSGRTSSWAPMCRADSVAGPTRQATWRNSRPRRPCALSWRTSLQRACLASSAAAMLSTATRGEPGASSCRSPGPRRRLLFPRRSASLFSRRCAQKSRSGTVSAWPMPRLEARAYSLAALPLNRLRRRSRAGGGAPP